jgi:predicted nucleotidyltransferase
MGPNETIDNITDVYKHLPGAWAIALFGSRAKGTATETSDVNLMVVESELASQSSRAQVLADLADPDMPSACRDMPIPSDSFYADTIKISVWHIPEDLVCERVSTVLKNRRLEDSVIVSILHDSRILWDTKNQLRAWKNIVSPLPVEYKRTVVPILFSEIAYGLEIMKPVEPSNSLFFMHHELMALIKTIYEIIFISNNSYFTFSHRLDQDLRRLESVPEDFLKHIRAILSLEISSDGLQARWRRICHLTQLLGEHLDSHGLYNLKTGWVQLKRTASFLFEFDK